jgi:membrane protease subunit (stomatin/prohibitin family)
MNSFKDVSAMFSTRHKTSMFLGSQSLFVKTSLITMLSALAACGSGGSQNDAGSLVAESNEQQFVATASNTEQATKPKNIWNQSAWDKTVWTSQPAAQSRNWNNDSWSETLWQ